MKLTLSFLEQLKACPQALRAFKRAFPSGVASVDAKFIRQLRKTDKGWEAWLLAQTPHLTRAMLAAGADPNAYDSEAPWLAAFDGHEEVVKLLLAAGADPDACDEEND
jgi:hypothetical protein